MKGFVFISFLLCIQVLVAQNEVQWKHGIYTYTGILNDSLVNKQQFINCVRLVLNPEELNTPCLPYSSNQIPLIQFAAVNNECVYRISEVEQADFPATPFWDSIKNFRILELRSECELRKEAARLTEHLFDPSTKGLTSTLEHSFVKQLFKNKRSTVKIYNSNFDTSFKAKYLTFTDIQNLRIECLRYIWWNKIASELPITSNFHLISKEIEALCVSVRRVG